MLIYYPANSELQERLRKAERYVRDRLLSSVSQLNALSPWGKHNLNLDNLENSLSRLGFLLYEAFNGAEYDIEKSVLVDYGGGSGLLSFLARALGVKVVIYSDIYDLSCKEAELVGHILGLSADYYLAGDETALSCMMNEKKLACDVLVSNDVIEHVYTIEKTLQVLSHIPGSHLKMILASGANKYNPYIYLRILHRQVNIEKKGRKAGRECDTRASYSEIRYNLIKEYAANLSDNEVRRLARQTRGLMHNDIHKAIDIFRKENKWPRPEPYGYNTCDPFTGYWEEHFMVPHQLAYKLGDLGFSASVVPGLWFVNLSTHAVKRMICNLLNVMIRLMKNCGLIWSPFYIVKAQRIKL